MNTPPNYATTLSQTSRSNNTWTDHLLVRGDLKERQSITPSTKLNQMMARATVSASPATMTAKFLVPAVRAAVGESMACVARVRGGCIAGSHH